MWFTILLGLLAVLIYFKVIKLLKYWDDRGVANVKPWPFFGNMGPFIFKRRSLAGMTQEIYNLFPEQRYVGFIQFFKPTLIVRDPSLLKQMTVKDFDNFPEHQLVASEDADPLWNKNLLGMKGGQKWHDLRTTLSPSFTSSKLKIMFGLMKDCVRQFTSYFEKQEALKPMEMKDTFARFANDVIGTAAFGVTCDSMREPDNEFFAMGSNLSDFTGLRGWLFFLYNINPAIMKILKFKIVRDGVANFFRGILKQTIKIREEQGIVRPDMIHLLMEARKGRFKQEEVTVDSGFAAVQEANLEKTPQKQKTEITDEDIVAQALIFFFAGFDTVSSLLSFLCYELALNPKVQAKLVEEIEATLSDCNGDVTYEALLGMKYLDMVISEALRKWPPAEITDRNCVKDYVIQPELPAEKPVCIQTTDNVWVPIFAIHRDPQYYPEPEKFNPERFSDDNKKNIKPFTYMPFGLGPRACIGSRFALLEAKLVIFETVRKFEIVPVEKTQIPLGLAKGGVNMTTEKGIWLGFKPRKGH